MDYKELIVFIINKLQDERLLKRIYELAEYLYAYKDGKGGAA